MSDFIQGLCPLDFELGKVRLEIVLDLFVGPGDQSRNVDLPVISQTVDPRRLPQWDAETLAVLEVKPQAAVLLLDPERDLLLPRRHVPRVELRGQGPDGPIRPVVGGDDGVLGDVVVELDARLDPLGGVGGRGGEGEAEAGLVVEGGVGGREGGGCRDELGQEALGVTLLGGWRK